MGGCVSSVGSYSNSTSTATAKLISLHGELREYSAPVTVSQVLHFESSSSSCFVCNSDSLYYDDYIPAMNADDELLPGQIYFLLSATKLQYRLSASEMAAWPSRPALPSKITPKRLGIAAITSPGFLQFWKHGSVRNCRDTRPTSSHGGSLLQTQVNHHLRRLRPLDYTP
ncbi:hypothetical protein CK203_084685 [Vitis vinifera]|uniref:Uncharacterized protein n=1 Tax=Vitis vinifera TaxID=29760 RepID=A0A438EU66_VITVI|nr:hypothetical protein CK203_084685 [Vitis vinifera]